MVELFFSLNNDENTKVIMLGRRGYWVLLIRWGKEGAPTLPLINLRYAHSIWSVKAAK